MCKEGGNLDSDCITRNLLNQPGTANLSNIKRYLPPQAEILHDLAKPFVWEELLSTITGMKAAKAIGSDAILMVERTRN